MCAPYLSVHMNESRAIFVVLKGTGRRWCYSLLLILRILIGLHGLSFSLHSLPPFGIVIMALDGVFKRVDVNNFFENDVVYTMLLLKTEGGEEDLFLKIPGYV